MKSLLKRITDKIMSKIPKGETDTKPTQAPQPNEDLTKKTIVPDTEPKGLSGTNKPMPSTLPKK